MVLKRKLPTQQKAQEKKPQDEFSSAAGSVPTVEERRQADEKTLKEANAPKDGILNESADVPEFSGYTPDLPEDKPVEAAPEPMPKKSIDDVSFDDDWAMDDFEFPAEVSAAEAPNASSFDVPDVPDVPDFAAEPVAVSAPEPEFEPAPASDPVRVSEPKTQDTEPASDFSFDATSDVSAAPASADDSFDDFAAILPDETPAEQSPYMAQTADDMAAEEITEPPVMEDDFDLPQSFADEIAVEQKPAPDLHVSGGFDGGNETSFDAVSEDDWGIASDAAQDDIYGDLGADMGGEDNPAASSNSGTTPPWKRGAKAAPAQLPGEGSGSGDGEKPSGGARGGLVAAVAVVLVGFVGYQLFVKNRDYTAEMFARWTGNLDNVSQEVPVDGSVQPEEVVAVSDVMPDEDDMLPPPEAAKDVEKKAAKPSPLQEILNEDEALAEAEAEAKAQTQIAAPKVAPAAAEVVDVQPKTQVEFVDVPAEEAKEDVVADESVEMPQDLSLFASLQSNIMKKREEKRKKDAVKLDGQTEEDLADLSRVEKARQNAAVRRKVDQEMEEYLRVLTSTKNPENRPSPGEYFDDPSKFTAQPADAVSGQAGQRAAMGAAVVHDTEMLKKIYGRNPQNLPIVPEPEFAEEAAPVRHLNDFEDVVFEPKRDRVRMPAGVRPRLGAAKFPRIDVLSLVKDQGIIAFANGREGVLLIGERIDGWELVAVHESYAEFREGKRKHIVTLK